MIRNGYARRLQAEGERSRLAEHWQVYSQAVQQSLQVLLRDHGLLVAQLATKVLVEYAVSSEAIKGVQDVGLSCGKSGATRSVGDLKGMYSYFPLRTDSQSLLPPEQYLVVDTDYEMVHLMQQGGLFLQSMRSNDVELAILLPLFRSWPDPASYETVYESLCMASWEGTFREFRRGLPALLNECTQQLSRFGMEIIRVDGSRVQLISCA